MIEDRRADERDAVEAARRESIVVLPATTWREIQGRASSIGVTAELLADGGELHLVADVPVDASPDGRMRSRRRGRGRAAGLTEAWICACRSAESCRRSGPRRVRPDPRADRRLTVLWLFVFGGVIADALAAIGKAIDTATGGRRAVPTGLDAG